VFLFVEKRTQGVFTRRGKKKSGFPEKTTANPRHPPPSPHSGKNKEPQPSPRRRKSTEAGQKGQEKKHPNKPEQTRVFAPFGGNTTPREKGTKNYIPGQKGRKILAGKHPKRTFSLLVFQGGGPKIINQKAPPHGSLPKCWKGEKKKKKKTFPRPAFPVSYSKNKNQPFKK